MKKLSPTLRIISRELWWASLIFLIASHIFTSTNIFNRFIHWPEAMELRLFIVVVISGIVAAWLNPEIMQRAKTHGRAYMNRTTWIFLGIILAGGIWLRFWQLDYLFPAGDEYRHLNAAKHFLSEGYFEYGRSSIITKILITIRRLLDTDSLFWQRFPFALMGSVSIVSVFLIGKLKNIWIGLIAAFLFAFCPLAVGLSRYIREYELISFLSLIFLFLSQLRLTRTGFLDQLPRWTQRIPWRYLWLIALIPTFYLIPKIGISDGFDAALMFLSLYIGVYMISDIINHFVKPTWLNFVYRVVILGPTFFIGIQLIPIFTRYQLMPSPEWRYLFFFNFDYFNTTPSPVLWYPSFVPHVVILLLALIPIFLWWKNSRVIALSFTITFALFFFVNYFNNPRRFQERYIYYLLPYFLILISYGIYAFGSFFKSIRPRIVLLAILLLMVFNPFKTIVYTLNERNGQTNQQNGLAYFDADNLIKFIDYNQIDVGKVLTTRPWIFDYYYNEPYLKTKTEKNRYINFPWASEFNDRTRVFSVSGYWAQDHINNIQNLLRDEEIDYLIFHGLTEKSAPNYQYEFITDNFERVEPWAILNPNVPYTFYIYRVKPWCEVVDACNQWDGEDK